MSVPVKPVAETFAFPLSFAQRRLWFLDRLQPNNAFYNISLGIALEGTLDVTALRRTLDALVARHESLRTRFDVEDGEPVQIVSGPVAVPLPVIDLEHLPATDRVPEARRLATDEANAPFDLSTGPVLRARLFRLAPNQHVLVLVIHHIVCDGWSLGVLSRELGELYRGFSSGRPASLPELPVQYADFSVWQRQWMSGPAFAKQLGYWRARLEGMPATLDLPTDRPRPLLQSYQGAAEGLTLPRPLLERLRVLGQREGATLFMTLLSGRPSPTELGPISKG
jgi:hypothetical protein